MIKVPFYALKGNYEKVKKYFGNDFLLKSYYDELTTEEVILANDKLSDIVYGEELSYLLKEKKLDELKKYRDRISSNYNLDIVRNLDDYGILLVRPETLGCLDKYKFLLNQMGLAVIYEKYLKINIEQYILLYYDGMMVGLSNNDDLFDFPTRTFNYIDNLCYLLLIKNKCKKLDIPVSDYISSYKGKHGSQSYNTFRGDIGFNSLRKYVVNGTKLINFANVPLDPIGACRALVRGEVNSDGWHDKVDIPILFYCGQSVHIPNSKEISKDLGVLINEKDVKLLIKK